MFEGMPVWHVSVARIASSRQAIKERSLWSPTEVRNAARIAVMALDGVGGPRQWHENGETAIHIRRQLTQPEIDLLHSIRPACPVFTHGKATVSA